jgi:hypothetical protein
MLSRHLGNSPDPEVDGEARTHSSSGVNAAPCQALGGEVVPAQDCW